MNTGNNEKPHFGRIRSEALIQRLGAIVQPSAISSWRNSKIKGRAYSLILCGILLSCSGKEKLGEGSQVGRINPGKNSIIAVPENIIILSGNDVFWTSVNPKPKRVRDSVGSAELIAVDSSLNQLIDRFSSQKICQPASFYRKQYQFLEDGDQRLAYVNLFPKFYAEKDREDYFSNWKTDLVRVDDGGNGFCIIEFDILGQHARLFQCNGPG